MSQGILMGSRTLVVLGARLVFVLALGALLAGCGGSEEEGSRNVPSTPEEAGEVTVRVSGTEGTAYSGTYGTIEGDLQDVDETLGSGPTEYGVEVEKGVADGVTATFQKIQPDVGELKVEILADDELVVESRTFAEFGVVNADWFPPIGPPQEILSGDEGIPFEDEDNP